MIEKLHPLFEASLHIGCMIDMTGLVGQGGKPGLVVFERHRALYDPLNQAKVEKVITDKPEGTILVLRMPQET